MIFVFFILSTNYELYEITNNLKFLLILFFKGAVMFSLVYKTKTGKSKDRPVFEKVFAKTI